MTADSPEPRPLGKPLLVGILVLPLVFSWFLVRSGYSNTLRVGAFAYAALTLVIGAVRASGS